VHLADVWVNRELQGSGGERFQLLYDPEALEMMDVDETHLPELWEQAQQEITEVTRQFLRQ